MGNWHSDGGRWRSHGRRKSVRWRRLGAVQRCREMVGAIVRKIKRSEKTTRVAASPTSRLVQLVRTLQIKMLDEAASVRARAKMVVQRRMWPPRDRDRLDVAADTAVDKHRLAFHLTAIIAKETML